LGVVPEPAKEKREDLLPAARSRNERSSLKKKNFDKLGKKSIKASTRGKAKDGTEIEKTVDRPSR